MYRVAIRDAIEEMALSAGLQEPKPLLAAGFEQSTESRIIFCQLVNSSLNVAAGFMVVGAVVKATAAVFLADSLPLWENSFQV